MPERNNGWQSVWRRARGLQSVLGLVLVCFAAVVLSPVDPRDGTNIFLSPANVTDILRQVSEIGIMALATTFVILAAGIDLGIGSVLALSASFAAKLLTEVDPGVGVSFHIALAIAAALVAAALIGALNGVVIARLKIQPFIVTLASMIGVRGLARWLTDNTNIDFGFGSDVAATFAAAFSRKELVIGSFVILAILLWFLLMRTVFGRYVRALGDNATAAHYAGLPTRAVLVAVYTLSGLFAGYAGVLHAAQNHQGNPNDGVAYELEAIAAVVIGGTSLSGGKGSIGGTIVGTLLMGVLTNLFRLRGVDVNVEMMVKALIILAAVRIQQKGFA